MDTVRDWLSVLMDNYKVGNMDNVSTYHNRVPTIVLFIMISKKKIVFSSV